MSTPFIRSSDVQRQWILIDAEEMVLGRMATIIANILRGKNKACFTPNADCGDYVVVINADKVALTGKKLDNKKHYWHSGYPGGIKNRTMKQLLNEKCQDKAVRNAVRRMMSKGPLTRQILSKLKVYKGSEHPHEAQQPKVLDIAELNRKNSRRAGS
ncbi:MAG: 50S ribosomal protein L13 [Holosporales bacterium]|jgi:large subunit ribosomal protein L13|nr:50S ribosomal protein L13 [Holosporales bacterium]